MNARRLLQEIINNNPHAFRQLMSNYDINPTLENAIELLNSESEAKTFAMSLYTLYLNGEKALESFEGICPACKAYEGNQFLAFEDWNVEVLPDAGPTSPQDGKLDWNQFLVTIGSVSDTIRSFLGRRRAGNDTPPAPPTTEEKNNIWPLVAIVGVIIVILIILAVIFMGGQKPPKIIAKK